MIRRNNFKAALFWLVTTLCSTQDSISQEPKTEAPAKTVPTKEADHKTHWQPLLEKDSLKGWQITNFGGEGSVDVKDGVTRFGNGDPLTGVTIGKKDFPKG